MPQLAKNTWRRRAMDTDFGQAPSDQESVVNIVKREAEEEWRDERLPLPMLDDCAREAVDALWLSQVKTFVPLLALRRVRACARAGTCDCDDW
jgi:hypothetical protein